MGTNYYHVPDPCPTCGHGDERHVGKSSAGWCFSLHVYPEDGIHDLPDWTTEWAKGTIRNEYGDTLTPDEMFLVVTARHWPHGPMSPKELAENEAVPGPNNLTRHRINDRCVKHGSGPWDCIVGEFS